MCLKADPFILTLHRLDLLLTTTAVSYLYLCKILDKLPCRCGVIPLLKLINRLFIDLIIKRRIILTDKLLLYLLQYFLFPLFQRLHITIGCYLDDLLYLIHKIIEVHHLHLVVYPVGLSLMQGLDDFVEFFVLAIAVVLDQLDQVTVLEVAAYPVFLLAVFQDTMTLKDVVFELPYVKIAVFEHFFTHAVQLSVDVVSTLDQSQLKLVLVSVCVWIVASMRPSENKIEPQPINEAVLLEAYDDAVTLFLHLYERYFLKLVLDDLRMRCSYQKIQLTKIEHSIEHSKIILLRFVYHVALLKHCIDDRLCDIVQQGSLPLQLSLQIIPQTHQKSLSPIHCFHYLIFVIDGRQQSIIIKEDIMSMQQVIIVRSNG